MTTHRAGRQHRSRALPGRSRRVLLGALALILTATGTAAAYWSGSGVGAGSAATDTGLPVTITPGAPSAQLYPGGEADVSQTISNPNPYDVRVESLSLDTDQPSGGYAVDAQHEDCDLSTLTFTTQTNGGSGWTVPAASGGVDGSLPLTLTDALEMGTDAANACQGASFTVYLRTGS